MIADLLISALSTVLEGVLAAFDAIVPQAVLDWVDGALSLFGELFRFGPLASVLILLGVWLAVDTAAHAYAFAWNTYRLLPAKFT